MKKFFHLFKSWWLALLLFSAVNVQSQNPKQKIDQGRRQIAAQIERSMRNELLNKWYPRSVDSVYGGFLSTFTYDFQPTGSQDKMIVSQARHVWSNALAARLYPQEPHYRRSAEQGFYFLKNKMWDQHHGGFFTLVSRRARLQTVIIKRLMVMHLLFMPWQPGIKPRKMKQLYNWQRIVFIGWKRPMIPYTKVITRI